MASGARLLRSPTLAKTLVKEAEFALMIYVVVAALGICATIGASRLGHPLFSLIADDSPGTDVQKAGSSPASTSDGGAPPVSAPDLGASEIPVARLLQSNSTKKIVPNNPSIVVGTVVFDSQQHFVGRVISVHTAPVIIPENGAPQVREYKLFVTIENKDGVARMFDYGSIEWRAAISSSKITPDVGVIKASLAPESTPQQ